jgi:hypothetical protein
MFSDSVWEGEVGFEGQGKRLDLPKPGKSFCRAGWLGGSFLISRTSQRTGIVQGGLSAVSHTSAQKSPTCLCNGHPAHQLGHHYKTILRASKAPLQALSTHGPPLAFVISALDDCDRKGGV